MAAAFVQATASTEGSSVTTLATTYGNSTVSGNLAVISACCFDSDGVAPTSFSISDSFTNSYSLARGQSFGVDASNDGVRLEQHYSANITGGASHEVTVSFGDTVFCTVGLLEFSGVATTTPSDGVNSGRAVSSTPSSGSVTPGSNGIFCGAMSYDNVNLTMALNWTGGTQRLEIDENNDASAQNIATKAATAASADTAAWTLSASNEWAAMLCSYKEAAGGVTTRRYSMPLTGVG